MKERKKPWFDRFLEKHPRFPVWFSVFVLIVTFKNEIFAFICWLADQI